MRRRRRALSAGAQRAAARRLAQRVARRPWFLHARSVAFYLAADGEIDPGLLLQRALELGKRVYLPVLRPGGGLWFGVYRPGVAMRANRFGIAEPLRHLRRDGSRLDLVLMPLVAFDRRGGRLGMGGGFYDRTFAGARSGRRRPRLVGLAHSFQEVDTLPCESWDVPLAAVTTEREWIAVRRRC